eukprot:4823854-Pleurochrysis_carterae.AAC.1
MAAAGRACGAALRNVLDALGADGTLGVVEEAAALQATAGVRAGPAVKGGMAAQHGAAEDHEVQLMVSWT